ncbi:MAG: alpha/beta hydrolase [Bacteroidia bacterium]|nr:alpha/beta hydrolase [Bacteroidia bacterium]MCZ2140540.1 alpha/beta hydrolase [Bacteroidia bacterium]
MSTNPQNILLIVSDMWGFEHAMWLDNYILNLKDHFIIKRIDCNKIGKITASTENAIHQQFLDFGIDLVVEHILYYNQREVSILGFSIGGFIAWQAGHRGLSIKDFYAVSSTRLRLENYKPNTKSIHLYYGSDDSNIPNFDWHDMHSIKPNLIPNGNHLIYRKPEIAKKVCSDIISSCIV